MRNGSTLLGTATLTSGGVDAGGYTCQINIADDGKMACRTDTETAYIRDASSGPWIQAFRWGENVAEEDFTKKNFVAAQVYEIVQAPSNSNILYASAYGKLWKTTDRCQNWLPLPGFKSGALDTDMRNQSSGGGTTMLRLGHNRMAVHPTNPSIVGFFHPKDGLYYSLDGGTTWQLKSGTAPTWNTDTPYGGEIVFDRSNPNRIVLFIDGVGFRVLAAGFEGSLTTVAGGPAHVSSIEAANGNMIYACGSPADAQDSQLYAYNGTSWSQPSGIAGFAVSARLSAQATVMVMSIGGDMHLSTNSGSGWTTNANVPFRNDGAEVPWLAVTANSYMALGGMRWHPTANRLVATYGLGTCEFDNPPRTDISQKWRDTSGGIKQLLIMEATVTSSRILFASQDRPIIAQAKADAKKQITGHGPDYDIAIRHANSVDYAADDENYLAAAMILDSAKAMVVSQTGGGAWSAAASWPTRVDADGNSNQLVAGNVAIGNKPNIVWAPTNKNRMVYTLNGVDWLDPVFKTAGGATIDMTGTVWHPAYFVRKVCLAAEKHNPGTFVAYSYGAESGVSDNRCGFFKSTDGGATWTQTRLGRVPGQNFFSGFLRLVPGRSGHLFFANGPAVQHLGSLAPDGLYFSSAYGAGLVTMPGFSEVEDVAVGKGRVGSTYPRLYVAGWRGTVHGIWVSDDFDPANPTTATWTRQRAYANGRSGAVVLKADINKFGWLLVIPHSGGHFIDEYDYKLRAS